MRRPLCVAWLCVLCAVWVGFARGQAQQLGSARLVIPHAQIDEWLRAEISRHGGDFQAERYHFIIGFSTGHFGSHPLHASAMHRVAFAMLNQTLAAGDQVTPVAWEMGLCEVGDTITLTDDPASRGRFVSAVPYAPWHGGRGGHDVERTLYETLETLVPQSGASHTVILLLTNSNQSQAPPGGGELFGGGNPLLRRAMAERGYAALVRHRFVVSRDDGDVNLNVDITALFPARLTGLPDAPRVARAVFPADSWQPPGDGPVLQRRAKSPWLFMTPVLIAAGAGAGAGLALIGVTRRARLQAQELAAAGLDDQPSEQGALQAISERLAMLEAIPREADRLRVSIGDLLARIGAQQQLDDQLIYERQEAGNARRRVDEWQELAVEYLSLLERATVDEGLNPAMRQGMEVSLRQFERLVRRPGIAIVAPKTGELFDEVLHRYVGEEKSPLAPPGTVLRCESWGYQLGGRVARQAQVVLVAAGGGP